MKRLLINALHREEVRVAIAEDNKLLELEIERQDVKQLKGNIYKAKISRIEPSLQAAFIDIGSSRNGFLQINDINQTYFNHFTPPKNGQRRNQQPIQEVLKAGQEIVVQVVKDEREAKGATLTTNLSIPGRFLVLMIGSQRGGVSRKIVDEVQRKKLKQAMSKLVIPAGMGVIVRTAGLNKTSAELQRDLNALLNIWSDIISTCFRPGTPTLLYEESDLARRAIRDYLRSSFSEILVDEKSTFDKVDDYLKKIAPNLHEKLSLYDKPEPILANFGLDTQIDTTNNAEVDLPSGGSIVINPTEAIVSIDVNSKRSTSQADVEETAFNTNIEAAESIAQQLRLRDLGGLVVIDFIDMMDRRHKYAVESKLRESVKSDRAKIEVGRISRFGLLEMSRQRLKASLTSQNHVLCPQCVGRGQVKTPDSVALEALRKVESAVMVGGVKNVKVHMSPSSALFMLNEKRRFLSRLEETCDANIKVYADSRLKQEEYQLILDTKITGSGSDSSQTTSRKSSPDSSGRRRNSRKRTNRKTSGNGRGTQNRRRSSGRNTRKSSVVTASSPAEADKKSESSKPSSETRGTSAG